MAMFDYWSDGGTPANPGRSSSGDPRGRAQNEYAYQQNRFNQQQGPAANQMAQNFGRASEQQFGDYTDIMNQYRGIYSGAGGETGSAEGGGGYSTFDASGMYTPFLVSYDDPFKSYEGFEEFSKTGGYSPADIANMRARGVGPVRSAYANAERELGRQRSLQGGYAPNAVATLAKMAREQGQASADATQNVEAGLASERQKGRLAGLTGMSGIEGQRLGAQIDVGKFNAGQQSGAQAANIGAAGEAAANSAANSAAIAGMNMDDRFRGLSGATQLYGTTPGLISTTGNQLGNMIQTGGNFGTTMLGRQNESQGLTGRFDQTANRIGQLVNTGAQVASQIFRPKQQQTQQPSTGMFGTQYNETVPKPRTR